MSLAKELQRKIADPSTNPNDRARLRSQLARRMEETGDYEGARRAMGELWTCVGARPMLEGLDQATTAEVLLRAGALTGWIGSVKQIDGAQEIAKNLITESIAVFEELRDVKKVAEAQTDLGYCYWRAGAFDEARVWLREGLSHLTDEDGDLKAIALLRLALVEKVAQRPNDALRLHMDAAPLFEVSTDDTLKGRFHNEFAQVLRILGTAECRDDYIDRALIEYAAASFHFERAGHARYHACVENNLGFLFHTIGKFSEAHQHLDRAQAIFTSLKDSVHIAQVDDTRARVMLTEGRASEAERVARSAVQTLEKGGEQALLAEALTTHGIALARLGRHRQARLTLQNAIEVAQQAGDTESAGRTALTVIELLGDQLSNDDLIATYERAVNLVADSKNLTTLSRLSTCARRVMFFAHMRPNPPNWTGFSFKRAVRRYEARLIELALRDAGGIVTRAAHLLGFKHHHSLASILNKRHRNLLPQRSPVVPRKRSIITVSDARRD